jgi:DNA-binding IclR family transcriptional regulator
MVASRKGSKKATRATGTRRRKSPPEKAVKAARAADRSASPQARPRVGGTVRMAAPDNAGRGPQHHRTIDRVTHILEEVVYRPGMTFAELVQALGAAKSSVHGFIRGLLAQGWLYQVQNRFYLGPAVYGLTLASGHIRAGLVTHEDMVALHEETGVAVFLGVQAGDHLIYIAEAGSDPFAGFEARTNIRRTLLATAGGKALLSVRSVHERDAYLRRRGPEEAELVDKFLADYAETQKTGVATNYGRGNSRFAIATVVYNQAGEPVSAVTLVGPATEVQPRKDELSKTLLRHVRSWSKRSMVSREAI